MSVVLALAIGCLVLAIIPAILFCVNLRAFQRLSKPKSGTGSPVEPVSVLIPARNEAASIERAVNSVLANRGIVLELIVLDDQSTDETASLVNAIGQTDDRVRVIAAPPLPEGWCGKQHACQILAEHSRYQTLLWMDADVQLSSDALAVMASELARSPAALISGFPFERTSTSLETLLIPLIHFILLSFLPLQMMRRDPSPSLGAGCGQLFMARRKEYFEAGGHAAIRASLHDGIALPRAFRKAEKTTDLFDASDLAQCRMYDSAAAVWRGLLKNAGEGIATPTGIVPWTIVLFGGQVLPAILTIYLATRSAHITLPLMMAAMAMVFGIGIRLVSAHQFYARSGGPSKYLSSVAHPVGILVFIVIQWHSLLRRITGTRATWKGRSY